MHYLWFGVSGKLRWSHFEIFPNEILNGFRLLLGRLRMFRKTIALALMIGDLTTELACGAAT